MTTQQQQALDSLYAIDNVLTIKITMPQGDWDAVRTEQPKGGICNFEWKGGARFTWRKATSVEIEVVPGLVELEVAVPRSIPAVW